MSVLTVEEIRGSGDIPEHWVRPQLSRSAREARPLYRRSGDPKRMRFPSGSTWEPSRLPYS